MKHLYYFTFLFFLSLSANAQVDVSIQKTLLSSAPFQYGNSVAFSIVVTNNGADTVTNILLRDVIPCGMSYIGDINIWSASGNDRTILITNTLLPGESTMVGIDFTIESCTSQSAWLNEVEIISFTNVAGIDITSLDVNTTDNTDVEIIPIFDVALTKKLITPQPYNYGDELTFEIEIFNQGNQIVRNINIFDHLPSGNGYNYVPASNVGWNGVPPTLNRLITPDIVPGSSTKVLLKLLLNPTNGGERVWINYAEIGSAQDSSGDPIFDADSSLGSNTFLERDVLPLSADDDNIFGGGLFMGEDEDDHDPAGAFVFDLALIKTQGSALLSFSYLQEVEYVFTVINQGSQPATNIVVNDYLPPALSFLITPKNTLRGWSFDNINNIAKLTYSKILMPGESDTLKLDLAPVQWYDNPDDAWTDYAEISSAQIPNIQGFAIDLDSNADDIWNNDAGGLALSSSDNAISGNATGIFLGPEPGEDEDDHDPHKIQIFDLALEANVATPGNYFLPETDITLDITVYNQGNVVAKNIAISNYIPAGFEFIAGPPNIGWNGDQQTVSYVSSSYLYPDQSFTVQLTLRVKDSPNSEDYFNYTEISSAQDTVNNNRNDDADSRLDNDPLNDNPVVPESAEDDVITGNSFAGGDEDDHDVAAILLLCIKPTLTTGIPTCSPNNTYSVLFYSDVENIISSVGMIVGNRITEIPLGIDVEVTAYNSPSCFQKLTVLSPNSCPPDGGCVYPKLTAGQPLCNGNNTWSVSFSNDIGVAYVTEGDIIGNVISNIPIGTNITLSAINSICATNIRINSPEDCNILCANSPISISGPLCNNNSTYKVNFITSPGVVVISSNGLVSNGMVTNIPSGQSTIITVTSQGCENRIITIPASDCLSPYGRIGKLVWHDINGNGQQDGNEPGISGVQICLFNENDFQIDQTTSLANGVYAFNDVEPGNYYLKFNTPSGYTITFSNIGNDNTDNDIFGKQNAGKTPLFTVSPNGNSANIDAGYYKCVPIGDLAWYDINKDDVWNTNENGINGLKVRLWRNHFGTWLIWDNIFTGPKPGFSSTDGYYNFCAPPGQYYVEVVMPPLGLVKARADIGGNEENDSDLTNSNGLSTTDNFTVLSGQQKNDLGAGFYPMAEVGNLVWNDSNMNGVQEEFEEKVSGIKVEAILANNGQIASTTYTDENGLYNLNYLEKQDYYLKFSLPDGYGTTIANATTDDKDNDVDHSNGPYTTRTIAMTPGTVNQSIDMGVALGVLPVVWLDVFAKNNKTSNLISWNVAAETNVADYVVERSLILGDDFIPLGSKIKAQGNASLYSEIKKYSFDDLDVANDNIYYYRVKQTDYDGRFSYSKIVKVERHPSNNIDLFPNPARNSTELVLSINEEAIVKIELFTMEGVKISDLMHEFISKEGSNNLILDVSNIAGGMYNIMVTVGQSHYSKKLIIVE